MPVEIARVSWLEAPCQLALSLALPFNPSCGKDAAIKLASNYLGLFAELVLQIWLLNHEPGVDPFIRAHTHVYLHTHACVRMHAWCLAQLR